MKNKILGKAQSERKYKSTFKDRTNADWRFYESLNTSVDFNSVENIFNCLSNYDLYVLFYFFTFNFFNLFLSLD